MRLLTDSLQKTNLKNHRSQKNLSNSSSPVGGKKRIPRSPNDHMLTEDIISYLATGDEEGRICWAAGHTVDGPSVNWTEREKVFVLLQTPPLIHF